MTDEVDLTARTGQTVVDELLRLLDVQQEDEDVYLGKTSDVALQRVFGGQVAAQALVAAGRSVPEERAVHSLHSYFIRPGDIDQPIRYHVERVRDGRSFSVRRVVAKQSDQTIFTLSASFQPAQAGIDHQVQMPDVPDPESLPTLQERYAANTIARSIVRLMPRPFDMRYIEDPSWAQRENGPRGPGPQRVWMKTDGVLPDDPLLHICALTFGSDLTLLDTVLAHHGLAVGLDPVTLASLDHAMWFHRRFRADEWFLYSTESPSASGGRGLVAGYFFTQDGRHMATVMQEGMIRLPNA